MPPAKRQFLALLTCSLTLAAQSFTAPAGIRPALRKPASSILPGGRVIAPLGDQYGTGAGPFGLLAGPSARIVVTSNGGPGPNSFTVLDHDRAAIGAAATGGAFRRRAGCLRFRLARPGMGLAHVNDHSVWASEGNSGRVSLFDWSAARRRAIDLNQGGFRDSYTGDLACDAERGMLYVVDQANFRMAVIDLRTRQVVDSVRVGRLPFALALSPDRSKLYVTNVGMFEYRPDTGRRSRRSRAKPGCRFPAFGFPSADAASGAKRQTAKGPVHVPGLGDPNVPESNSLAVVDVSNPGAPKVEDLHSHRHAVRRQQLMAAAVPRESWPRPDHVFVSNAGDDSVTVIDAKTNAVTAEIPIRIAGLETLRGVLPVGHGVPREDAAGCWWPKRASTR